MTFTDWVAGELDDIRAAGRWRQTRPFDAHGPAGDLEGAPMVSFASNDYLGLSTHRSVVAAAHDAIDRWGTGATASRLVVGSRPIHHELEEALAAWKGTERALVFPTGYAANLGVLSTLGGPDCLVVSDELNHASIIDGCRLSRSPVAIARHNDVDHVDALLAGRDTERAIVVVDTVFSMDGDEAPVAELAAVCAARGAVLVLDEAHAVLGPCTDPADHPDLTLVRVVTLSKALGSMGGAVCGTADVVDLLVNRARPFIFSTGLSPADAAAGLAAVEVVTGDEGAQLLDHLRCVIDRVAPGHPSPIIPVVIGAEYDAMAASASLAEQGLLIPAIRPPTVPEGTARLRIALSAAHDDAMIDRLVGGLAEAGLAETGLRPQGPSGPLRRRSSKSGKYSGPATIALSVQVRMPSLLLGVAGTSTEVGKTHICAALATELRHRGLSVAARKPAQSFSADGDDPTDAEILAAATGEQPEDVCPRHRWYPVPMAPPMAAAVLGRPAPLLHGLLAELSWSDTGGEPVDVGMVETVGGVRSPLADDADSRDLLRALDPDLVVVVADAGLGTIDAVRLAVDALTPVPTLVFLNRFDSTDDLHLRNRQWLVERDGIDCTTSVATLADRLVADM